MKIFIDANILFSACNANGNILKFIKLTNKKHNFITCEYAQEEAARNLHAKKAEWFKNYKAITKMIDVRPTHNKKFDVKLAERDAPILASAVFYGCDYLVTGDKGDFGHLFGKKVKSVKILPPDKLMEEIMDLG